MELDGGSVENDLGSGSAKVPESVAAGDAQDLIVEPNELNGVDLSALDEIPTMLQLAHWAESDYPTVMAGTTAKKLASSAVAPLVALARGYKSGTEAGAKREAIGLGLRTDGRNRQFKRFMQAIDGDGVMLMPWYSIIDVVSAERAGSDPGSAIGQFRPHTPMVDVEDGHGKARKYEGPGGKSLPMDIHPAFPSSWLKAKGTVLMAEGLIKGDSAISAYLLAHGATKADLSVDAETSQHEALVRMRQLLVTIPEPDRVLVLTFASVTTWQVDSAGWVEVSLKGRDVWIGFDADVDVNPRVWQAATKLWTQLARNRKAVPFLVRPLAVDDQGRDAKAGLDDFLATMGTWEDLERSVTERLPTRPTTDDEAKVGDWRVDGDGTSVSEYVQPMNQGVPGSPHWERRVAIGAQVISEEALRIPSMGEIESGRLGEGVTPTMDATVQIRCQWEMDDEIDVGIVTGPASILGASPKEWLRLGANVPSNVLRHPQWPPSDPRWMQAIKSNRHSDIRHQVAWKRMGWVPTSSGVPSFMAGDQIIVHTEASENARLELEDLRYESSFGFWSDEEHHWQDVGYQDSVRKDLTLVLETMVQSKVWQRTGHAAAVISTGLRPAIPLRPSLIVFCVGEPNSGKSWSAQVMMSFWAARQGDWSDTLPGSANDTMTFAEDAISKAPIWVIDDWAPSASKSRNEREGAQIGAMIRAVFNNTARGRAGSDMRMRVSSMPNAVLVITAENEGPVVSERQRYVPLNLGRGALHPDRDTTDAVDELRLKNGAPARLTGAMIRYLQWRGATHRAGWSGFYQEMLTLKEGLIDKGASSLKAISGTSSGVNRAATLIAEQLLPLEILKDMGLAVGLETDLLQLLGDQMPADIVRLVSKASDENQARTPGRSLVESVRIALASGMAHVANPTDPALPPFMKELDQKVTNSLLGWQASGADGTLRPMGVRIGWMVQDRMGEDENSILILDISAAFNTAQRAVPELIPHGQQQKSSWTAVWNEGLAYPGWKRKAGPGGREMNTVQVSAGRVSGVPVALEMVLGSDIS